MKCIYYLSPTLKESAQIADDLHAVGISDWYLHIVSKDESGLRQQHLQTANYIETLDLYHSSVLGGLIGFCGGIVLMMIFSATGVFSENVPWWVYVLFVGVITLFGIWEGGLWGVDTENKKLEPFHDEIQAGKYLILIYTKKEQEQAVRKVMADRHPDADMVAVDTHFVSPFSRLKRV
ncbi:hypothetical protein [Saccharospirillum salsuginis]|uniref:DUF1269 domain-containing protein n=1 Tax=Saccharospirillum salsuginis TaxID=418750 RepID=A0A918KDG6_9GAMM|nr:hypothetical protein [Saccharospirillum salsuginis]GGX58460.1 hypothetical protein GCM10007392_27920 [Saccharospirillum salsuginis]